MRLKKSWPLAELGKPIDIDGAWLPRRFTVVMEHDDPPTTVRLRICLIDGRFQATELSFANPEDVPLEPHRLVDDVLRRLPKLVEREVLQLETMPLELDGHPMAAENVVEFTQGVGNRQRRREIDDDHLARVAEVYNSNAKAPTKAVQDYFVVSPATASRWVKRARDHKLLRPR